MEKKVQIQLLSIIHLFNTVFGKKTKWVTFACHEDTLCIVVCGGSRSPDERGGGGGGEGVRSKKFSTLWASVWYKITLGRALAKNIFW